MIKYRYKGREIGCLKLRHPTLYLIHIKKYDIYKIGITRTDIEERLKWSTGIGCNYKDETQKLNWQREDIDILFNKFFYIDSEQIEKEIKKMLVGKVVTLIDNSGRKIYYQEHFYKESLEGVLSIINKYDI
jgi:hypothetical protein